LAWEDHHNFYLALREAFAFFFLKADFTKFRAGKHSADRADLNTPEDLAD
jgi:hypothetical protein